MAIVTDLETLNRDVTEIMLRHYGDRLAKIILFGSYARGDFHDDSDVDYAVTLNEDVVSPTKELKTYSADFYDLFLDKHVLVSAFAMPEKVLKDSSKAIYRNIKRDGKIVYERPATRLHRQG